MLTHLKSNCSKSSPAQVTNSSLIASRGLTKKAEPPPTRDVNRDSGTASANGGWLRRLVRRIIHDYHLFKSPSLTAVLHATTMLMPISIVPTRTEPETFRATPSKTKTMAVL